MDDTEETVDLDQLRTFFDPHPGFAGAAIPIPGRIKKVADDLDGQTLTLKEAIARLQAVGIGEISVVARYEYIGLRLYSGPNRPEHFFRVIRYRSAANPGDASGSGGKPKDNQGSAACGCKDGRRAKRPV